MSKGYVYVLYNTMYSIHGECYKIGQTKNIEKRLKDYTTYYADNCEVKYITDELDNYKDVEKQVHKILKEYRINTSREFFKCNLDIIIDCIKKVSLCKNIKENKNIAYKDIPSIMREDTSWLEKSAKSDNIGDSLAKWLLEHFEITCINKNIFCLKYNDNTSIVKSKELFKNIYSIAKYEIFKLLYDICAKNDTNELRNYITIQLKNEKNIRNEFINTIIKS